MVAAKPGGRLKVGVGVGEPLVGAPADDAGIGEALPETSGSTMTGSSEALGVGEADAAGEAEEGGGYGDPWVVEVLVLLLGEDVEVDDVVPLSSGDGGCPAQEESAAGAGGSGGT